MDSLIGRLVRFFDRGHQFDRYGTIKDFGRIGVGRGVTKEGKVVKRRTVMGAKIIIPNGKTLMVAFSDLKTVVFRKKEIPIKEWIENKGGEG